MFRFAYCRKVVDTPFKSVSFFDKVDKLLEVYCHFWTCTMLVTPKKLTSSSLWKFIYHVPEGIPKPLPTDFSWVSVIKCCLHNIFGLRHLIPKLELTNYEALLANSMPPKMMIPTPSAKEIERHYLEALEQIKEIGRR